MKPSLGGAWYDLGLTRIALDSEGFTYIAIGLGPPALASRQVRIRAVVVEPVLLVDTDEAPAGGWGLSP